MDASRFDIVVRALTTGSSRRGMLPRLAAAAFSLGFVGRFPGVTSAKKGKQKVNRNAFGCVNVGRYCKHDNQCCSGICRGKKGKRKCRNHDAGVGCQKGDREEGCGGTDIDCTSATGFTGVCDTTTGNAPYCVFGFECMTCRKDADCRDLCGPAAACIRCANCDGFETACVGPSQGDCSV